jgi:hypothetical protein
MSDERFWHLIDLCRTHAVTTESFTTLLEETLAKLPAKDLWAFHQGVWKYVEELQFKCGYADPSNTGFNDQLNDCLSRHMGLELGGDTGECYVGWVISQGREFYDLLRKQPQRAAERLPTWDEIWQGENVLFVAMRVFRNRTGQDLLEVFTNDTSE